MSYGDVIRRMQEQAAPDIPQPNQTRGAIESQYVGQGFGTGSAGRFLDSGFNFHQDVPTRLGADVADQYNKLAAFGLFPEDKVNQFITRQQAERRRKLIAGARQGGLARRLGPRSGAIDQQVLNAGAGQFGDEIGAKLQAFIANEQSKLTGLRGVEDFTRFIGGINEAREEREDKYSTGALDWAKAAGDIAGAFG